MHGVTCARFWGLLALMASAAALSACSPSRHVYPGRPLGYYDYCVLGPNATPKYFVTAEATLAQSFVVLREGDPRVELPSVRQKACTVSIDWTRGFWGSSGWVDVKDYGSGTPVLRSHVRGGMLWMGIDGDVKDAIRDVAAARAAGPPLPPDARNPIPARDGGEQ
jgi:hypothetical protein